MDAWKEMYRCEYFNANASHLGEPADASLSPVAQLENRSERRKAWHPYIEQHGDDVTDWLERINEYEKEHGVYDVPKRADWKYVLNSLAWNDARHLWDYMQVERGDEIITVLIGMEGLSLAAKMGDEALRYYFASLAACLFDSRVDDELFADLMVELYERRRHLIEILEAESEPQPTNGGQA